MSKLCKIKFYTDLNAFEIYKCKSLTDESVDADYELNDHVNHWKFNWGDRLAIDWSGNISGDKYFLRFENNNKNSNNQRKSPIEGHHDDASFEIVKNQKIVFVKEANDEAEWSFNFYWGASKDIVLTADNSIDPNAKIKDTPW
jgi:hypothetical protein